VFPSIADMTQVDDGLEFSIQVNLESFVAGIDMTETTDTNAAPQARTYDQLRGMEPAELEARFRAFWPQMADAITVQADGTALPLELTRVDVSPVGDVEVTRPSVIGFRAALPAGAATVIVGWDRQFGTMVLRQQGVPEPYDGYLEAGALSDPIALSGGGQVGQWQTFFNYIPVGFDHIVPKGLDHILFVLGLFFLSTRISPLLWQISAFTLAHTITLALAALGYVRVPPSIVEPLIAASIVFVAVENLLTTGLSPWRPFVVFGFGLLHGLGFASVLGAFGLPEGAFVPALIGFNLGVEFGQLSVVAVAFACVLLAVRVDRGSNATGQAKLFYIVAALIAATLALIDWRAPAQLGRIAFLDDIPLWVFLGPMSALFALCWLSVANRDQLSAYRRIVSNPASVGIAIVGSYWFVQRVFF
jgi:hypothetical protein